jgi:hypothetical protein
MKPRNDLKPKRRSDFRQKAGKFLFLKNAALCRDAATNWLCICSLLICISATAALPSDWQHEQSFEIASPGLVADNVDFRAPEALAGIELGGTALDVSGWKFRKPVKISGGGAQQLELDLDVLAHADAGFADLRVMRGSNQVPYIVQHTSISRTLAPSVTPADDAKQPKLSRWMIKLPQAGLPLTRLGCETDSTLFQRDVTLYEELTDERGEKFRRNLGGANWTQTPDHKSKEFVLTLDDPPRTGTLFLETENGDNPPVALEKFAMFYPATRILFKAKPGDGLFLYYGNPRASAPSYDLSLVAGQLLAADKTAATAAAEEQLKKSSWRENEAPGNGGVVFWGMLAVVVVVLLAVISRLLPKSPPSSSA